MQRPSKVWFSLILVCLVIGALVPATTAADRIILRNLQVINDRTVVRFDEDGLRLDDGSQLGWDEIEAARIGSEQEQARFDRLLTELGGPLYRIRQRLRVGDYRDVLAPAAALAERYQTRESAAAYVVLQAHMWGLLANGQREAALTAYLKCLRLWREHPEFARALPGDRRLAVDRLGFADELTPVWFDAEAAKQQLPRVSAEIAALKRPRPLGVYLYYATLALAAGQPAEAERVMNVLRRTDDQRLAELTRIVAVQFQSVDPGMSSDTPSLDWTTFSADNQPLALYWLGRAALARAADDEDKRRAMLLLLRIPAVYGDEAAELAGAALALARQTLVELNQPRASVALRTELLTRYGQTWHAARQRAREAAAEAP